MSSDNQTQPAEPDITRAIGGAAMALEMCASALDAETAIPDHLAKAAVIAYLTFTGREAEADAVSNTTLV